MELKTITVNKSEKQPEGITIDVVVPQSQLEIQTLAYLLTGFVRDAEKAKRFNIKLPTAFSLQYQSEGSFLISTAPGPAVSKTSSYYQPPKPLAVLAIQQVKNQFDLAYAEVQQSAFSTREQKESAIKAGALRKGKKK